MHNRGTGIVSKKYDHDPINDLYWQTLDQKRHYYQNKLMNNWVGFGQVM